MVIAPYKKCDYYFSHSLTQDPDKLSIIAEGLASVMNKYKSVLLIDIGKEAFELAIDRLKVNYK